MSELTWVATQRAACERLLLKLFLPVELTKEQEGHESIAMIDQFWNEYEQFDNRQGPFGESRFYIWDSTDIKTNFTYRWHKKYSLTQTQQLGRLACRVTSKILGMGNAERCWGVVKQLKDGQRSHLSAEKSTKAATIYGAACAERANLKKPPAHLVESKHWEQSDLDSLGLDRYGVNLGAILAPELEARVYKCWTEDWEYDMMYDSDLVNQAKFLTKYGGLVFQDGDTLFTGNPNKMHFSRERGNYRWMVFGCKEAYNPDIELKADYKVFDIDDDFHGIVFEYYRLNPNPLMRIMAPPNGLAGDGSWDLWIPEEESAPTKKPRRS